MKLPELNERIKRLMKEAEDIAKDCSSTDELEVLASSIGVMLASFTKTTDEQKSNIFKVGFLARQRIAEKEAKDGV